MQPGRFIPVLIPYKENGQWVSAREQAMRICSNAQGELEAGAPGVAITYSANYQQTNTITETYDSGGWRTRTDGANQAAVMSAMEDLLAGPYSHLQHKLRIAPITTITYSNGYKGKTHETIVREDLQRMEQWLQQGWYVMGWMNQDTAPRYAVGGGVARLPE